MVEEILISQELTSFIYTSCQGMLESEKFNLKGIYVSAKYEICDDCRTIYY